MAHVGPVYRWEVYWVDLDPHVGSEQGGKRRPGVVVSNDGFNQRFNLVTIVPLTKLEGKKRKVYPFEIETPDLVGTGYRSIVMPQQVRSVSKLRLLQRAGSLSDEDIQAEIENRLLEHLGIDFEAEIK